MKPLPPPSEQQPLIDKRKRIKGLAREAEGGSVSKPVTQVEGERLRMQRAILRGDASDAPLRRTKRSRQLAREHKNRIIAERLAEERAREARTKQVLADALRGYETPPETKKPAQYIHVVSGGRCSPK